MKSDQNKQKDTTKINGERMEQFYRIKFNNKKKYLYER